MILWMLSHKATNGYERHHIKDVDVSYLSVHILHISIIFFLNYKKAKIPFTYRIISKNLRLKNLKYTLILDKKKKINPISYVIITLYKNIKIKKHLLNISRVFFFKGMEVII